MNKEMVDLIKMIMPLIILNYAVVAWCIWLIIKKGVRNLSKVIWVIIVLVVNGFGPIIFLIFGRKK